MYDANKVLRHLSLYVIITIFINFLCVSLTWIAIDESSHNDANILGGLQVMMLTKFDISNLIELYYFLNFIIYLFIIS